MLRTLSASGLKISLPVKQGKVMELKREKPAKVKL
jgi:hypothetical protein